MVRNTLKYVANKDIKAFAKDLKTIYTAPDEVNYPLCSLTDCRIKNCQTFIIDRFYCRNYSREGRKPVWSSVLSNYYHRRTEFTEKISNPQFQTLESAKFYLLWKEAFFSSGKTAALIPYAILICRLHKLFLNLRISIPVEKLQFFHLPKSLRVIYLYLITAV